MDITLGPPTQRLLEERMGEGGIPAGEAFQQLGRKHFGR